MGNFELNSYFTLIIASMVLLIGNFMTKKISFLKKFNIPIPVAGGLLVAFLLTVLHYTSNVSITIDTSLQEGLMLMFFASIGLGADFSRLKEGGKPFLVLTIVVAVFILLQDLVGVSIASLLGVDPRLGLVAGSITLTGGHGTAAGWGATLENLGVSGATTLGIACATFGLVLGGLIGGGLAERLIKTKKLIPLKKDHISDDGKEAITVDTTFEHPETPRLITVNSTLEAITMFAICIGFAFLMSQFMIKNYPDFFIKIPNFVWALGCGVIVRNILSHLFKVDVFDRCIDVIGNVSLSLFLAMALVSLKLWELIDLAIPILIILGAQTLLMITYAYFVTFRALGKDYDAAVIAAGHCGFGMGATPTAVANMQAITSKYMNSHKAFLIVPLVGAFFVDLINASVISSFVSFLSR
ncbi:sodium/glutamate symporter [Apibacter muscae]|uniref:Sodium/glutamate symporter n=1 Tax=Apibacter muscae TaxID=2509004 RepID=A0A563DI55_9FLAO|nr:sodium/glutamate symporter [Apibacter muscae]TWP24644.1 sodium/glutamate symporter [Apibacter muscae]TWP29701.1 sodium/glutamate symporter [Apibacter muscae]